MDLPHRFRLTVRGALVASSALALLGYGAVNAWAWWNYRNAHAALARHQPAEARRMLAACSRVWGSSPAVHLASCRAAWQDDDTEAATRELHLAQRGLGGASDETALEWALLHAAAGDMNLVEGYLQQRADTAPAEARLVWEALSAGYLRVYRTLDAMACLNHWLKVDPDSIRALELRGQTYVAGKGVARGSEDYRRVLELDPARKATRWRLIDGLLGLGGYEEASVHLEYLAKGSEDDPAVGARLARCYNMLGRGPEARALLERILSKHPDDGPSWRALGQVELVARKPEAAESFLRRASALLPSDYQAQQLLFQALQQQGKVDEAKTQLKFAEEVRERTERVGELTSRKLAESPLDPALHYEMGKLLLQTGAKEVAEQWLLTALRLDPEHQPAREALARMRGEGAP